MKWIFNTLIQEIDCDTNYQAISTDLKSLLLPVYFVLIFYRYIGILLKLNYVFLYRDEDKWISMDSSDYI